MGHLWEGGITGSTAVGGMIATSRSGLVLASKRELEAASIIPPTAGQFHWLHDFEVFPIGKLSSRMIAIDCDYNLTHPQFVAVWR